MTFTTSKSNVSLLILDLFSYLLLVYELICRKIKIFLRPIHNNEYMSKGKIQGHDLYFPGALTTVYD